MSAFAMAWERDAYECAKIITEIMETPEVNEQLTDGQYPMHRAATYGDLELVQLLFSKGADVLQRAEGNNSLPSTFARNNYHQDVTEWLAREEQNMDVYRAATRGDSSALETILEKQYVDLSWKMLQLQPTEPDTNPKTPPVQKILLEKGFICVPEGQGGGVSANGLGMDDEEDASLVLTAEEKERQFMEMTQAGMAGVSEENAKITTDQYNHNTALMQAALYGYVDVVTLMLGHKHCTEKALNTTNNYGQTALNLACHYRRSEIAIMLTKMRAVDLNIADNDGLAPVHVAVVTSQEDLIKRLLLSGVDLTKGIDPFPDKSSEIGKTAEDLAAVFNPKLEMEITDYRLAAAAFEAVDNDDEPAVAALISKQVNLLWRNPRSGKNGNTALIQACSLDRRVLVNTLNTADCGIETLNDEGMTALMVSCQLGHADCVASLVSPFAYAAAGPDTRSTTMTPSGQEAGSTALMICAAGNQAGCVEVILDCGETSQARAAHPPSPDIQDVNGYTALAHACQRENPDIVRMLLEFGASPNQAITQPDLWAENKSRDEAEQMKIDHHKQAMQTKGHHHGHRKSSDSDLFSHTRAEAGDTALHLATRTGSVEMVRSIIRDAQPHAMSNVDQKNADGNTAVHIAVSLGHVRGQALLEILIDEGLADAETKNNKGITPFELAKRMGEDDLVTWLASAVDRAKELRRIRRIKIEMKQLEEEVEASRVSVVMKNK